MLAPDVVRLWIDAPHVARNRRPGQFAIIRLDEEGERIPLTIADAGGDIMSGGATVMSAMGAGRRAAGAIDRYLQTTHAGIE